jgi:hypothetical protein
LLIIEILKQVLNNPKNEIIDIEAWSLFST